MKESQCLARIREISQYWVDHFRPCMEDDNNYYRGEGRIDGKDAAMIGEDFQEVLQLAEILSANQERLVGYALHCESEIRRLAKMLEETHDQFIDESHGAITEDRFQYEVARILEGVQP